MDDDEEEEEGSISDDAESPGFNLDSEKDKQEGQSIVENTSCFF